MRDQPRRSPARVTAVVSGTASMSVMAIRAQSSDRVPLPSAAMHAARAAAAAATMVQGKRSTTSQARLPSAAADGNRMAFR